MASQAAGEVRRRRARSLTILVAATNLLLTVLASVLLLTASGSHLSRDVHDGGVIFMLWTLIGSPVLQVLSLGTLARDLLVNPIPNRSLYVAAGLAVVPLALSAWVLVGLTR